jgi:hypothetical protein
MLELRLWFVLILAAALLFAASTASAEEQPAPSQSEAERQKRLDDLAAQVKVLSEEIQSLKTKLVLPETREYKSLYGLGPAASKVYQLERGLSIGGYGEASLKLLVDDKGNGKNTVDVERFVLYTGYKFTDRILLNAEIEFEHATTEETVSSEPGSVNVEFAYLDFRLSEPLNARTGLLLIPMGFINEIHEPPFFFGNRRPEVERRIIPATWSELGAGIYGTLLPGLEYRTYVVSSLNAKGFSSSDIRDARQAGNQAFAEDVAWTGRIDYTPIPGLLVGASFFWGDTGQDQTFAGQRIDANLFLYDVHVQFEYRGLRVRGLYTEGRIGDARTLSTDPGNDGPISRRIWGAYGEVAYDVLPLFLPGTSQSLWPFARLEWLDTQADVPSGFTPDRSKAMRVTTLGVSYKPIPQVVFKLDYRELSPDRGEIADEVNIGFGFAF